LGGDGDGAGHRNPPSHLLLEDQVYALTSEPLVLGRSPAGARTLPLPEGIAGVSRRHCTLTQEGGEVVLLDHSSFGTFVNGERVVERVRVRAGDRVRLGDPGVELALISINAAPDPTNHTSHTNQTNRPIRASQQ
jgi:predicted component of type VI protein secretion system